MSNEPHLNDADGFPGEVEAGVEQESEDEGESSVPERRERETDRESVTFITVN